MSICSEKNIDGHMTKLSVMFENDPARRNRSIVGPRHLPFLHRIIPVSAHLALYLLGN